ncbi:phage tail protein [Pseudomonas sp. Hg5Tf]|uniref:Phage tail protein n=1 Tax=Pseudomonas sp. Hg7Tf TaxID=3236988 RepID=A0AB39HT65_9PSED|nr:phage tail protein [Pseudomonas sp. Hg5Tf]MDH2559481.1 phage tail protein [Pseudomonas sp. Hg5Tf]
MVDQTSKFYAILTNVGAAKQANADALGIPWKITQMAVGDGNPGGVENPALPQPDASWTSLLNEWRRAPLNQLKVDDKDNSVIVAEQVIPAEIGGRWIREVGLYDADGDLVAVANCAPTYKPLLNQGSGRTQVVRMNLVVSSSSNVQLKIDPSVVLATREYVDGRTVRASQPEAEAGAENSKIMTPLRVFQAIAKVVRQATETAFGWAKVATQSQVTTGTDDNTIITPKKFKAAMAGIGLFADEAPYLDTCLKHVPTAVYRGYGWGNPMKTLGIPEMFTDPARNSLLAIAAERVRADATKYQVYEFTTGHEFEGYYGPGMTEINWRKVLSDSYPATESAVGGAKLASQVQVTAGTDDATIVTPKKFRAGLAAFGIGAPGTDIHDADLASLTGVYRVPYGYGCPTPGSYHLFHIERLAGKQSAQIAIADGGAGGRVWTRNRHETGVWSEWDASWTKSTLPLATQDQVNAGADDTSFVTPKKLRFGFAASLGQNGYIALPSWMGGLIIQWGYGLASGFSNANDLTGVVNYPLAFPSTIYAFTGLCHPATALPVVRSYQTFLRTSTANPLGSLSSMMCSVINTQANWQSGDTVRFSWLAFGK